MTTETQGLAFMAESLATPASSNEFEKFFNQIICKILSSACLRALARHALCVYSPSEQRKNANVLYQKLRLVSHGEKALRTAWLSVIFSTLQRNSSLGFQDVYFLISDFSSSLFSLRSLQQPGTAPLPSKLLCIWQLSIDPTPKLQ